MINFDVYIRQSEPLKLIESAPKKATRKSAKKESK